LRHDRIQYAKEGGRVSDSVSVSFPHIADSRSQPRQPAGEILLRRATTRTGQRVDVLLGGGRVVEVAPPSGLTRVTGAVWEDIDLDGYVLLPGVAEPHAHLDHALTWESLNTGYVELPQAIAAWAEATRSLDVAEARDRILRALAEYLANGVTALRSHSVPCLGDRPLAALEAWQGVRQAVAGVLDIQVVFMSRIDTPSDLIRAAVDAGADLIGGVPYMTADPAAENERLLSLAAELSVGVDLHVDEELDASVASLEDLATRVAARNLTQGVTASHCVSLGIQDPEQAARTIARVAQAGLGVVTLPYTNLYLMGRTAPTGPPRALTALRPLLTAGVPVAAGGDNLRDPFNPVGRADPLAVAALLVSAGHLTIAEAYDAVSVQARRVLGLPPADVVAGAVADLLAVRATSLDDAVARSPEDRIVIQAGRVVACSRTVRRTAL
jgi:cytosine/creatinine deaminase